MTMNEIEEKIGQLERDLAQLRQSFEYRQSIVELREAIAEIDTDPGMPLDEFAATFKRAAPIAKAAQ